MSYTTIDQALKDSAIISRIKIATLRWSYLTLADSEAPADEKSLAKLVLRGDKRLSETLTRAILVNPSLDAAILVDDATGDQAIDTAVEALIPAALALGVVSVVDPDGDG